MTIMQDVRNGGQRSGRPTAYKKTNRLKTVRFLFLNNVVLGSPFGRAGSPKG